MVGRIHELERLLALLSVARAGRPSFVLLGGEAGIGKTTLAEALTREARRAGANVLTGRCYDLTMTPPYGPWTELLRSVALTPQRSGDLNGAQTQLDLFEHVWEIIARMAADQPLVLVLEDLHWADQASLDLLRFVGRRAESAPTLLALLVIATYRDDALRQQQLLSQMLAALVREARAERISLHPFDRATTETFLRTRYTLPKADESRLVEYLLTRGDGNPFFMSELLRSLEDEWMLRQSDAGWRVADLNRVRIPAIIRQVLDTRVARLTPRHSPHSGLPQSSVKMWGLFCGIPSAGWTIRNSRISSMRLLKRGCWWRCQTEVDSASAMR